MAKAIFHRHQRVYVEPVGTWAAIEHVKPVWVAGFDEPIRVTYDCGLGRDFRAEELTAETEIASAPGETGNMAWRLMRARNRVQAVEDCAHHPHPGTYPVVVTDPNDWGGWRVPGAEYDRDPALIEMQARLITAAPRFFKLARELNDCVKSENTPVSENLARIARRFEQLRRVIETPPPETQTRAPDSLPEPQTEPEVAATTAD